VDKHVGKHMFFLFFAEKSIVNCVYIIYPQLIDEFSKKTKLTLSTTMFIKLSPLL